MKPKAKSSFVDRFQQIMQELDAFKDHEARIKALEEANETKVSLIRVEPNMSKFQFTQADLDAAVDKVLKDSLTGKLKYSQATLDAAVAEAKADGKRFSNRPCFTPREHNMLKKAAVEAERERCGGIASREGLAWVASPQIISAVEDACENIQKAIEAGE